MGNRLLFLALLLMTLCAGCGGHPKEADLAKADFTAFSDMQVQYGDGDRLAIEDRKTKQHVMTAIRKFAKTSCVM